MLVSDADRREYFSRIGVLYHIRVVYLHFASTFILVRKSALVCVTRRSLRGLVGVVGILAFCSWFVLCDDISSHETTGLAATAKNPPTGFSSRMGRFGVEGKGARGSS